MPSAGIWPDARTAMAETVDSGAGGVEAAGETSLEQLVEFIGNLRQEQEAERTGVAARLHDSVGQLLTAARMNFSSISAELQAKGEQIPPLLESTAGIIDDIIAEVREIGAELRPGILDVGFEDAIEWHAENFQSTSGLTCIVDIATGDWVVDRGRRTELFRVFQEALVYVSGSTEATLIQVALRIDGGKLLLVVEADGRGLPVDKVRERARSLLSIRERVARLGGTVAVAAGDKGANLQVRIPIVKGSAVLAG
jgi:signal transduction histidine kinase